MNLDTLSALLMIYQKHLHFVSSIFNLMPKLNLIFVIVSPGKNPISGMLGSPSPRRQNPLKSHRLDSPSRNKKNLTPRKHAKFEHEFDNLDEKPEMEEVSFASTVRNGDSNRNPKDYSTLHQQEQLKQSTANTNILDNPTQVPITVDGRDYFRKVKSILTYDQVIIMQYIYL